MTDYWWMIIDWTKTKTKTITITKTGLYGCPQADLFCGNSNFHELDSNWKKLVRKRTGSSSTLIIVNYPWIYRELIFLLVRQKGTILHPLRRIAGMPLIDWWLLYQSETTQKFSVCVAIRYCFWLYFSNVLFIYLGYWLFCRKESWKPLFLNYFEIWTIYIPVCTFQKVIITG